jgi:DNA-binding HxlR family transcriptional regulator
LVEQGRTAAHLCHLPPAWLSNTIRQMEVPGGSSSRRRGIDGALPVKRAADDRARALVSIIRELMEAGFVSRRKLAAELNRRRTPTSRGGRWHYTTVVRTLTRLGLHTTGRSRSRQARRQAADAQAEALSSTIRALRERGLVSLSGIARELNERQIPAALGGKWHPTSVSRVLHRLARLETSSPTAVGADHEN